MNFKIGSDSSCNILGEGDPFFASVPMKIIAEKEYMDAPGLDVAQMVQDLKNHKGKSGSSCPNVGEWLEAFGDADVIFGVTISGTLSGSYSAACHAGETYMEEHPGRKVFILDSMSTGGDADVIFGVTISGTLSGSYSAACHAGETYMEEHPGRKVFILDSMSTGPEQAMVCDKLRQLAESGLEPEEVYAQALDYHAHIHTLFCLESLTNLARNGRINPAVAKLAGVLGIRVCGEAKDAQIAPVHKARGMKKAVQSTPVGRYSSWTPCPPVRSRLWSATSSASWQKAAWSRRRSTPRHWTTTPTSTPCSAWNP